jgi:hypothetical protein
MRDHRTTLENRMSKTAHSCLMAIEITGDPIPPRSRATSIIGVYPRESVH